MKILMPSDDGKLISSHFGRTRGFLIFEIQDNKILKKDYILNTITGHGRGMHESGSHNYSSHAGIIEALEDVQIVISHGMGRRLYEDLKNAGKEVYVTDTINPEEAIDLYLNGKLISIEDLLD
jgi:predicted Fe-Mo cluster-binding NifX family protein